MIGGAYLLIILQTSVIYKSKFLWQISFYNKFSKLLSLLQLTIRINLSCILLKRLLAFLEENIQIKGQ